MRWTAIARRNSSLCFLLVALLSCAGCGASGANAAGVSGIWIAQEIDGVTTDSLRRQPWVELDDGTVAGYTGCNRFQGDLTIAGGSLIPGDVFTELGGCTHPEVRRTEKTITTFLAMSDGIEVDLSGDKMTWSGNGHEVSFVAADEIPTVG